jgi:hypothetical protein
LSNVRRSLPTISGRCERSRSASWVPGCAFETDGRGTPFAETTFRRWGPRSYGGVSSRTRMV